jgi:hypothetical protein
MLDGRPGEGQRCGGCPRKAVVRCVATTQFNPDDEMDITAIEFTLCARHLETGDNADAWAVRVVEAYRSSDKKGTFTPGEGVTENDRHKNVPYVIWDADFLGKENGFNLDNWL